MTKPPRQPDTHPRDAERMRVAMAKEGPPRSHCPGCLRDLRGDEYYRRRGWCSLCYLDRERVLHVLLRVIDPEWRVPDEVREAEDKVLQMQLLASVKANEAEAVRRQWAHSEADLRVLRSKLKVCLRCHRAPSGKSNLCLPCEDEWRREENPPCARCGHAAEEHGYAGRTRKWRCLADGCECTGYYTTENKGPRPGHAKAGPGRGKKGKRG